MLWGEGECRRIALQNEIVTIKSADHGGLAGTADGGVKGGKDSRKRGRERERCEK